MEYTLPLDEMTTAEKLSVMERLWDDLCRTAEAVPSPAWHAPVLRDRDAQLRDGTEQADDWEEAKRKIREARR